jgi:hypothetical protein
MAYANNRIFGTAMQMDHNSKLPQILSGVSLEHIGMFDVCTLPYTALSKAISTLKTYFHPPLVTHSEFGVCVYCQYEYTFRIGFTKLTALKSLLGPKSRRWSTKAFCHAISAF